MFTKYKTLFASNKHIIRNYSAVHKWYYRRPPVPHPLDHYSAKALNGFFWWYILYNLWYYPEDTIGHYYYPDPAKWTDEELGIPPDDYPGTGRIRNKGDPPFVLYKEN
ncbi:NADH dehydrogenase [ubiquinone] 1 beta subcomplex subunit 2, mitochondrial-like [Gordionus sp. m RMFG-2023]|uniref:NADH dehydrogenase [ubiquinone] 1 beta subcomplex subunit 2, mitochondrial-like n=1 Tax=Gordionus sp. m RMFG-2023 TaxID=3053472 RepID=UPI0031FC95D3